MKEKGDDSCIKELKHHRNRQRH